jgi:hypothetical protein
MSLPKELVRRFSVAVVALETRGLPLRNNICAMKLAWLATNMTNESWATSTAAWTRPLMCGEMQALWVSRDGGIPFPSMARLTGVPLRVRVKGVCTVAVVVGGV